MGQNQSHDFAACATVQGSAAKATEIGQDHTNARALGNALVVCMIVPWALCFLFYTGA